MLDASTRVAAAKRSSLIDLHFYCIRRRPCRCGSQTASTCSRSVCCKEADLASLGWICVAEQLYTDGALVLDASTRVAEPPQRARSGLIDLHFLHSSSTTCTDGSHRQPQHVIVARKLTLRASGGSNTPSRDAADAALVLVDASTCIYTFCARVYVTTRSAHFQSLTLTQEALLGSPRGHLAPGRAAVSFDYLFLCLFKYFMSAHALSPKSCSMHVHMYIMQLLLL